MAFGGVNLEYAKGINLPSDKEYKNLKSAKKLAIDIGMLNKSLRFCDEILCFREV